MGNHANKIVNIKKMESATLRRIKTMSIKNLYKRIDDVKTIINTIDQNNVKVSDLIAYITSQLTDFQCQLDEIQYEEYDPEQELYKEIIEEQRLDDEYIEKHGL